MEMTGKVKIEIEVDAEDYALLAAIGTVEYGVKENSPIKVL